MWFFTNCGLICHAESGLMFERNAPKSYWWKLSWEHNSTEKTYSSHMIYMLEIECALWAYGRNFPDKATDAHHALQNEREVVRV